MPINEHHKSQITETLGARYFPIIPQLPVNRSVEEHRKNRLSRALAAFALEKLADIAPAQAANAVVDGGNDNGIDAIYFDRQKNKLWLVQAKAGGAPDSGDNKKFCDGVRDVIEGRFNKFNAAFARVQRDVEDALETDGLEVVGCHMHLGDGLGSHAVADLNQLKAELNRFSARFDWRDLTLSTAYSLLTAEQAVGSVDVTVTLEKWYGVEYPRRAFYGIIDAAQLAALYQTHGKKLFEKNIRHYLGAQSVNNAIANTVRERPAELFFLNNGLTAVCVSIRPQPGATTDRATFNVTGLSVVNGAQTVGSISSAVVGLGPAPAGAKVLITLIEVGTAQDNLGPEITRARNTQNAVKGLHFAALDPQQERLRQELAVAGIEYRYRPTGEVAQNPAAITLESAALALATLSGDTRTVVAAKKESGQLYDSNGAFYPHLFTATLSGIRLSRCVHIFKLVTDIFSNSERGESNARRRMFYRHGNLFVLHILARRFGALISKPEAVLSAPDKAALSRDALDLAELAYTAAEAMFPSSKGYLSLFRNSTDAEPLARDIMQRLAQRDAAAAPAAAAPTAAATTTPPPTPPGGQQA